MQPLFLVAHIIVCLLLILLVLLQQGKGADAGVLSGGAGSQTVFGSQGAGGFLFKLTATIAAVFLVSCLLLSYLVNTEQPGVKQVETIVAQASKTQKAVKEDRLDALIDGVVKSHPAHALDKRHA